MTRGRALAATTALVAGSLLALAPTPAQADQPDFAALGDSYTSGTGTRSYISDGTSCQRSVYSYPVLVATSRGYDLDFRACSGATTADVAALQVPSLTTGTAYVALTVGGNDAGFSSVLTECAKPAWMSNCTAAVDRARTFITTQLPGRFASLYQAIRTRAPHAKVVVAGYPRVFNGKDCNAATWFSATEMSRLNATADLLNQTIATAVSGRPGFTFSDPTRPFLGHAVCDSPEWINGLSSPIVESYHPNRTGQASGYTSVVAPALTGATVTVTAATTVMALASADELAAEQSEYAEKDRTITPKRFVAPDLTSRKARAAAARAGVDLSDRASMEAADRRHERAQLARR